MSKNDVKYWATIVLGYPKDVSPSKLAQVRSEFKRALASAGIKTGVPDSFVGYIADDHVSALGKLATVFKASPLLLDYLESAYILRIDETADAKSFLKSLFD